GGRPSAESFEYDPEGRIKSHITANGDTVSYQYDGQSGLLSKIEYSSGASVDYHFNTASELLLFRDESGTTEFKRDPFGRVTKVAAGGRELTYEYDPWGRVTAISMSGGYQIHYSRNMFGRLTSVDDGHGQITYEYHGREVVRRLPNGIKTTYSFSPAGRVLSLVHQKPDGNLLCSFSYSYRADGKLRELREET